MRSSGVFRALFQSFAIILLTNTTAPAQTGSDLTALKNNYRRPPPQPVPNPALAELGRDLFFSTQMSASGKTACASCHFPELGWGVTGGPSRTDAGKLTSRKSQALIGIGHAGDSPVGWDGRNASLEAQAKSSIASGSMSMQGTETPVKVEVIEDRIRSNAAYVAKFNEALPGAPINIDSMVKAIAAFERTIEPGIAPFDHWVQGDTQVLSDAAVRGFQLFTGKANCAGCHSGWRFTDDQFHDIGTTTTDPGRGRVVKEVMAQFAFKTPTLRSVALRPSYMHNASMATLHDVVKHYEKGGIDRPSRSPMMMPLDLSEQERSDLVAFMETLSEPAGNAKAGR